MKKLLLSVLGNALAIYIAAQIVPGFTLNDPNLFTLLLLGFMLGLINFLVRPLLTLISFPVIMLTLGLFTIIINIAMLFLLDYLFPALAIEGWWAGLWAMLVISAVNFFVSFHSKS